LSDKTSVKWLGHAAFEVLTSGGHRILVDPWISGNPACPVSADEVRSPDLILITHDHQDHIGEDLPRLIRDSDAQIVCQPDLARKLMADGFPEKNFIYGRGMNTGGTAQALDVEITMVQAFHSSGVGSPVGFIITTQEGRRIYHAGDTGIFDTMKTLGELYPLDLALLPIGSVFVMDPLQAAHSLTMLRPRKVIPMHYGTFPIMVQTPDEFVSLAGEKAPEVEVVVLEPGESLAL